MIQKLCTIRRLPLWLVLTSLALTLFSTQLVWSKPVTVAISQWYTTVALPEGLVSSSTVTYGDFVYVIGGKNSSENAISTIYGARLKLDGTLEAWTVVGQLPMPLYLHAAVVAGDALYVIGGWDGKVTRAEVWRAPFLSDGRVGGWTAMPAYPFTFDLHDAVVLNGWIYVVGGWNGTQAQQAVYAAKVEGSGLGAWQRVGDLPQALYRLAVASDGQHLYVTGGFTAAGQPSAAVYMAASNSDGTLTGWQSYTLPTAVFYHRAVIHDGRLVILGGSNGPQFFNQVYAAPLDATGALGSWQTAPALPAAVYRMGAVTVKRYGSNYIFVTGGARNETDYQSAVYHSDAPPPPTPTPTPTLTPTPTPTPGVSIALQSIPQHWIAPGEEVGYLITYQNQAPTQATDVVITNRIPNAVELVTGSIRTTQGISTSTGSNAGSVISWQLGTVGGGATGQVSYRVRRLVPPTPAVPPALTIDIEAPTAVNQGSQVTYHFTIANHAPATLSNLVITNTLPVGAVYVSGGDSVPQNRIVRWSLPTLAADSTATVQLVVSAQASLVNYDYRVTSKEGPTARGRVTAVTLVDGQAPVYGDGVTLLNEGARITWKSSGQTGMAESRTVSNPAFNLYLPLVRR